MPGINEARKLLREIEQAAPPSGNGDAPPEGSPQWHQWYACQLVACRERMHAGKPVDHFPDAVRAQVAQELEHRAEQRACWRHGFYPGEDAARQSTAAVQATQEIFRRAVHLPPRDMELTVEHLVEVELRRWADPYLGGPEDRLQEDAKVVCKALTSMLTANGVDEAEVREFVPQFARVFGPAAVRMTWQDVLTLDATNGLDELLAAVEAIIRRLELPAANPADGAGGCGK